MSKTCIPVLTLPDVVAASAITGYRFVNYDNEQAEAGEAAKGIARHDAAIGEQVAADAQGVLAVEAGAAIGRGAEVESDAQGRAIALNTGVSNGQALEAAAAAGDLIQILR